MKIANSQLIVVDVQGKLATLMHEHEDLIRNIQRTITITHMLGMPIVWSEQAPDKIGMTIEPVASFLMSITQPMQKRSFSCFENSSMRKVIEDNQRQQVLIVGIETHVCIYQTARDLQRHGYDVYVVEDAVSSKSHNQKAIAINRMRQEGITIVSTEMVACDWMKNADHPKFRDVMTNIKR